MAKLPLRALGLLLLTLTIVIASCQALFPGNDSPVASELRER